MSDTASLERTGVVTFKGAPMTLVGPELQVGDRVPDFVLTATDLAPVSRADLTDNGTKAVLMILVPSIDTSVCSLETAKFNRHVASFDPEKLKVVAVSADTPFAQKRWAAQEQVDNLQMLSDHKTRAFAGDFGVYLKELGLLARAVYLMDKDGVIRYVETVKEVATEPDYDAALAAARAVVDA